jgi:Zn-dependent protease
MDHYRENPDNHRISPVFGVIVGIVAFCGWAAWHERIDAGIAVFGFVFFGWIASLCLHEYAHARTAFWGGDHSVVGRGYLTLNPLKYVSPGLSLLFPLLILLIGGLGLPGGAVWVNMAAIDTPKKRSLVSLAGPLTNAAAGVVLCLPFLVVREQVLARPVFASALPFLASLQFIAAVLNILPIPGLDGFGAIEPFLSQRALSTIEPYRGYAPFLLFMLLLYSPFFNDLVFGSAERIGEGLRVPRLAVEIGRALFRFWN